VKIELCAFVVLESCADVTVEFIVAIVMERAMETVGWLVNVIAVVDVMQEVVRIVLQGQHVRG
jgi:hypothetical protein